MMVRAIVRKEYYLSVFLEFYTVSVILVPNSIAESDKTANNIPSRW